MSIFSTIIRRFTEPSTWGGIAVLLTVFGLSHDQAGAVTDLLAAVAATASVFLPEQGSR